MHWTDAAIAEIKIMRIPHRNYERALAEGVAALVAAAPGEVVCITGPSRVGKSRLASELAGLVTGDPSRMGEDLMPAVTVLASNCTNRGYFRTKDFTVHCLEAIRHPLYGVTRPDDPWGLDRARILDRIPESLLVDAFRKGLQVRKTVFVFFDETHQVRYALGGDREAAAILDAWKSLAAMAQVVLVLLGAYPLIDVLRLAPHMLGRKHQVHFPRYGINDEDLLVFDQILDAYSQVVQLPKGIQNLREWNDLLYPETFGCIGLLEGWLRDGLAKARATNAPCLMKRHLLDTRKSKGDLREIAEEIAAGERTLSDTIDVQRESTGVEQDHAPRHRKRKPFAKKPRRYPIGGRT